MSDKDNRRKEPKSPPPSRHDRHDHASATTAPTHTTTDRIHEDQESRPLRLEPEEDDEKHEVLDFALAFAPNPHHFLPVSSHQDMTYDHLHDPINYQPTSGVIMPPDHRAMPPYNYAGSSYEYSDPYYSEAFDASTQMEAGTYQDQYHGREGASSPEPVEDLQRIASLRSSSHDNVGIDEEIAHRIGHPNSNDHLSQIPTEGPPNEELFRGSLLNVDYHYHPSSAYYAYPPIHHATYPYNIPNTPIQTHQQYPPHASPPPMSGPYHPRHHLPNTPIQTQRYPPFGTPVEATMPRGYDDDDSSLDQKPPALPRPARNTRGATTQSKGKSEKNTPKKKSKPKKRQIRASRQSYGSSSSSSPTSPGVSSSPEFSFIRPDPEELNEAKTDRAKEALMNWHERLRDLYKFKKEKGHTKVPQKYHHNRELGVWVNKQRMEKKAYDEGKKSSMTLRKIEKLEQAGFEWGKPKGVSAWEEKYNELQQYIREKGDANVPTKYAANRALGRWVSTQRNMYKKYHAGVSFNSLLPAEIERRIELLNQLGFIWNMAPTSGSDDQDQKHDSQQDESDYEDNKKGR